MTIRPWAECSPDEFTRTYQRPTQEPTLHALVEQALGRPLDEREQTVASVAAAVALQLHEST